MAQLSIDIIINPKLQKLISLFHTFQYYVPQRSNGHNFTKDCQFLTISWRMSTAITYQFQPCVILTAWVTII